ncbi:MAG: arsenite methyltransferase [Candidatus Aminicenantes bacterium]|nr:arsenite methyltransferase [Candidatus Aminicenantes bacterium]
MENKNKIKKIIRLGYGRIAQESSSCCPSSSPYCGSEVVREISRKIGYQEEELRKIPEEANLGLGCGNPVALASLKEGEIVLDLGSGTGIDCFLAAQKVGPKGKVIGVDMTPEMVIKARKIAEKEGYRNVDFRLGEIENLPVADNSIDVIISNCVINLSPDKKRVFEEAYRVLKPGGRFVIADLVLLRPLPDLIKNSVEAYVGCLSGAILKNEYIDLIKKAGFVDLSIIKESPFPLDLMANDLTAKVIKDKLEISSGRIKLEDFVVSLQISGFKPINKS